MIRRILLAPLLTWLDQGRTPPPYPRQEGGVTVLGPDVFATPAAGIICWRGTNYYREPRTHPGIGGNQ